ncbi:MAG: hypothetical protein AAF544_01270, partial [Bacteroidota bacterium]
ISELPGQRAGRKDKYVEYWARQNRIDPSVITKAPQALSVWRNQLALARARLRMIPNAQDG